MGLGPVASIQPDPLCWAGLEGGGPPGTGSYLLPSVGLLTAHPATETCWTKASVKGKRVPCGKVRVCVIFGLDLGRRVPP